MSADQSLGRPLSPLAAISLKLVGVVTIISSVLDYIILLVPPNFLEPQWQLNVTTQLVDRGIVPLIGVTLLLTGFWVDRTSGRTPRQGNLLTDLRFWSCALASLLGLIFLILTFLHINNVRITSQQALAQVAREANDATAQLEQRLAGELSQQQNQLNQLFQNEALLDQAIQSGQLPEEISQFKDNPAGLDEFLQQRAGEARTRIETEIGTRREDAEKQVRAEAAHAALAAAAVAVDVAGLDGAGEEERAPAGEGSRGDEDEHPGAHGRQCSPLAAPRDVQPGRPGSRPWRHDDE